MEIETVHTYTFRGVLYQNVPVLSKKKKQTHIHNIHLRQKPKA